MRPHRHRRVWQTVAIAAPLLLAACSVGDDYTAPKLDIPALWSALGDDRDPAIEVASPSASNTKATSQSKSRTVQPRRPWWLRMHDARLHRLIARAQRANNELTIARAQRREAAADGVFSRSILFPQINGTASLSREKQNAAVGGELDTISQLGVSGTYEIDPFGGNRRRVEAAMAGIEAARYNAQQTELMITSEVARAYVRLRAAQKQRAIIRRNLRYQTNTLRVTRGQREEGAISDLEVARARAQERATAARLPQIENSIANALNRLSVLTNQSPAALRRMLGRAEPLPALDAKLIVTTPIDTIANRPDMRVAERRLAEASALSNAAFAQFFPKLTLEGFFGRQDSELYGSLSPWSASVTALLPILNFGRIRSQVDAADARQAQALANYQQTVLLALEETENALSAYSSERRRRAMLADAANQQTAAANIALEQYKAGTTTQLDLLTAQNNQLNAENDLVLSEAAILDSAILLYRALGEPWRESKRATKSRASAAAPSRPAPAPPAIPTTAPFKPQRR